MIAAAAQAAETEHVRKADATSVESVVTSRETALTADPDPEIADLSQAPILAAHQEVEEDIVIEEAILPRETAAAETDLLAAELLRALAEEVALKEPPRAGAEATVRAAEVDLVLTQGLTLVQQVPDPRHPSASLATPSRPLERRVRKEPTVVPLPKKATTLIPKSTQKKVTTEVLSDIP